MSNQSLRNKNPHTNNCVRNSNWKNTALVRAKVSECFCVNLWQMRSVPGQTVYADFNFPLIGGRFTLDYDENVALSPPCLLNVGSCYSHGHV